MNENIIFLEIYLNLEPNFMYHLLIFSTDPLFTTIFLRKLDQFIRNDMFGNKLSYVCKFSGKYIITSISFSISGVGLAFFKASFKYKII